MESKNEWRHFTGYTFFVSANLSDGNYTYNLYRNDTKIGDNLSNNTFLDANPVDNSANLYVVKINNSESESNPSNMVGITIGTALLNGDLTIGNYDMMTLVEESSLTVTGTIINTDEDNLILENGAQLIHSSEGVKATVKKSIAPINGNQGWNFIASPVTENIEPSKGNGLLNGSLEDNTYDLYYYEEPSHYWRNYETHSQDFTIEHKKGYLYANGEENGTTLQFSGTLIPSNNNMTISDLSHDDATLNGFNLVGNPFTCNATVNTDYYVIDASNNSVVLAETGRLISPCEGIFVKASETNNYQVTFSKPTRGNVVSNHIDFVISQDRSTLDRARVRFGKGTGMEKFSLSDNDSRLYIPQNGQDFAVAYASEQKEMPVNFKAMQDGIYTLTLEKESLELDYLHLVDNMTGSNIDLLTTPSYTFEATTRDYASRFRLLFTPENDASTGSASENIGFMVNGKFQLTEGEGVIQVIDASGRTLRSKNDSKEIDLSGLSAGVYVLRLISANNVKTQKIVIE